MDYSPWGRKESDNDSATSHTQYSPGESFNIGRNSIAVSSPFFGRISQEMQVLDLILRQSLLCWRID